jgi:hypothetical protein
MPPVTNGSVAAPGAYRAYESRHHSATLPPRSMTPSGVRSIDEVATGSYPVVGVDVAGAGEVGQLIVTRGGTAGAFWGGREGGTWVSATGEVFSERGEHGAWGVEAG